MKPDKQPKPILSRVYLREISTGRIVLEFYPTKAGEKAANRYKGLADLEIIKEYLGNKKQFSVPVLDKNDKEEEWFLVDLGNIDQFKDVKELNDYVLTLTPEVKEEQGISFTKKFKGQA